MSTATAQLGDLRSRLPDPSQFVPEVTEVAGAMFKATLNGSIPQTTISLVQLRAGQIVGNTYHTVAERVALELVEAVLTPNPFGERVPDELYARASAHYDDKALWTLTLV